MPKLPAGLSRWPSEKPTFFLGGHIVSDPEELFKKYGKIDIQSLPVAETGGRSASDMAFQDIEKIQANEAINRDIASKYEALQAKFGGQIPTSEYEKVFPPGGQPSASVASPTNGAQFGTTTAGVRVDESDPRVQALIAQGLNPDVAIGNVVQSLNKSAIEPSETPGILSSTNDPFKTQISDALAGNKASIDSIWALPTTLPPSTAPQAIQNLPQIPQTPAPGLGGDVFTEEGKQARSALETRRTQLESEQLEEQASIKSEFAAQRAETERVLHQNEELGRAILAGKGILPSTNSAWLQWFSDTKIRNQQVLNSILGAERQALLSAQKHYNNASFELLEKELNLASQMRERADRIQEYQTQNDFKQQELNLKVAEFQSSLQFSAMDLSIKEVELGLKKAAALNALGMDKLTISAAVQHELKIKREMDEKTSLGLASALVNLDGTISIDAESLNDIANQYDLDPFMLIGKINERKMQIKQDAMEILNEELAIASKLPPGSQYTLSDGTVINSIQQTTGGWQFKNIDGKVFKFNSKTGELVDTGRTTTTPPPTPSPVLPSDEKVSEPSYVSKTTEQPVKLVSTQSDAITAFDNSLDTLQRIKTAFLDAQGNTKVSTGPLVAAGHALKKITGHADPKLTDLETMLSNIKASFMKAISGAAVSEAEVRRLSKFLPDINDQEGVLKSKLKNLEIEINSQKKNFLNVLNIKEIGSGTTFDEIEVISPDGVEGTIPASQLDEALKAGYKQK